MDALIRLEEVTKRYDSDAAPAVDGVSMQIAPGEAVAVMGPSGSGKSTLLNLIAGLDRPTSGTVTVAGERIVRLSETGVARFRRQQVGMIFQFFNLLDDLTVLDNILLPAQLKPAGDRARRPGREEEFPMPTPTIDSPTTERTLTRRRPPGRRWLALALLVTVTAALSAACSSGSGAQAGPGSSPVASLSGHGGSTTGAPQMPSLAQGDQDFVDFTRCMRAHGVRMPDPVHLPGHAGLSIDMGSATQGAATSAAYGACVHFIAKILAAKQAGGPGGQTVADLPALTRWAQCMRDHDISMLDPGADGQLDLGNVPGITSYFGRYSPQFRAADHACRHLLPAGVNDGGTGP